MQEDNQQHILDRCLRAFISNFESLPGHNNWVTIDRSVEEEDAVQEFIATQVANGWMKKISGGGLHLTESGYLHHLPRAKYLHAKDDFPTN